MVTGKLNKILKNRVNIGVGKHCYVYKEYMMSKNAMVFCVSESKSVLCGDSTDFLPSRLTFTRLLQDIKYECALNSLNFVLIKQTINPQISQNFSRTFL